MFSMKYQREGTHNKQIGKKGRVQNNIFRS